MHALKETKGQDLDAEQDENKHISRSKHARRRRGKHGGQGGGESRHCA
eukprot:COSAG05_NODE_26173_length_190_cov_38.285714_1_plen_47_part_01